MNIKFKKLLSSVILVSMLLPVNIVRAEEVKKPKVVITYTGSLTEMVDYNELVPLTICLQDVVDMTDFSITYAYSKKAFNIITMNSNNQVTGPSYYETLKDNTFILPFGDVQRTTYTLRFNEESTYSGTDQLVRLVLQTKAPQLLEFDVTDFTVDTLKCGGENVDFDLIIVNTTTNTIVSEDSSDKDKDKEVTPSESPDDKDTEDTTDKDKEVVDNGKDSEDTTDQDKDKEVEDKEVEDKEDNTDKAKEDNSDKDKEDNTDKGKEDTTDKDKEVEDKDNEDTTDKDKDSANQDKEDPSTTPSGVEDITTDKEPNDLVGGGNTSSETPSNPEKEVSNVNIVNTNLLNNGTSTDTPTDTPIDNGKGPLDGWTPVQTSDSLYNKVLVKFTLTALLTTCAVIFTFPAISSFKRTRMKRVSNE